MKKGGARRGGKGDALSVPLREGIEKRGESATAVGAVGACQFAQGDL